MNQAVVDFFRCPEHFVPFRVAGPLSRDPGYFLFGPETICYGNSSSGVRAGQVTSQLYDTLNDISVDDDGTLRLPLDPDEIIDNLHYERYTHGKGQGLSRLAERPLVQRAYYYIRPHLPIQIRKHLQRSRLSDWRDISFPRWPADRTVEQILERLLVLSMKAQGLERVPFIWFWPDGARSCAIMTHDVEEGVGRNFCTQLMDLDESVGIRSSFQIVPEGRYAVPDSLLNEIQRRGFEIGIHDLNHDGRLFAGHKEFLRRADRINAYARKYGALGFRTGGLYRNQAWYDALDFSYDMSIPSVAHLDPQRGGCCSLMPFFIGRILELPVTTIQDYTLFHILNDYSSDVWQQQLEFIVRAHGLASFIVHPDYVIEKRPRAAYQALLRHLARMRAERRLWMTLPREVDRWWRERSQMKVVNDGSHWRIEGAGRERARLAFAALEGDRLTFTIDEESEVGGCVSTPSTG